MIQRIQTVFLFLAAIFAGVLFFSPIAAFEHGAVVMKLTVLGKYGPFPRPNGGTSSYLLQVDGKNILIDCGAGAFSRLTNIIKPEEIDVIFLSHFQLVYDI